MTDWFDLAKSMGKFNPKGLEFTYRDIFYQQNGESLVGWFDAYKKAYYLHPDAWMFNEE